ncbi:uncharacterized protein LOC130899713 [Diorhabda carinulata]|uniref:uncharacterized protein LOC130899713 n=1 Tax=Diorhabda carinulata TaxID=1163345 RepID=UPI0025A04C4C|nr:uncharacterized protein LOC130899713 [Diorhabda carinulata]
MDLTSNMREDDLLRVLNELNVKLCNLNPNVVKAWFDLDDANVKDLLNWMCTSLSKHNYISPLEIAEYNSIDNPLNNDELEVEKEQLDMLYPGIFDVDYNIIELEFLEEDLYLARNEERKLDEEIEKNRKLEQKLTEELTKKVKEEIESSVKLSNSRNKCFSLGEKLDNFNLMIHNQLLMYTKVLNQFEYSASPNFINNFNIDCYEEKINNLFYLFKSTIVDKSRGSNLHLTILMDDTIANDLVNMKHRILQSRRGYLAKIFEIEKIKAKLSYLEDICIDKVLVSDESLLNETIVLKLETKERLCEMLEEATKKFADNRIAEVELKYIEQEVESHRAHLKNLEELEGSLREMLAHYYLLYTMYEQEKKDLENYKNLFKKTINYINKDMNNCITRTEKMNNIIDNFISNNNRINLRFIAPIIKILSPNENNFDLNRAFELVSEFHREIDFLESKLFGQGFDKFKTTGRELRESIKVFRNFLISGPTYRVLLIPSELLILIRKVEDLLKKQLESVKSAINIVSSSKENITKWQNYKRQLWMYFCADPNRLNYILQEIQEEVEKSHNKKF